MTTTGVIEGDTRSLDNGSFEAFYSWVQKLKVFWDLRQALHLEPYALNILHPEP